VVEIPGDGATASPTRLAPSADTHWSVRVYSATERRCLTEIPIPEAVTVPRNRHSLAFTRAGIVAGPYYGSGLTLRTVTGELRWHRRDIKKVGRIDLIHQPGQPERLGLQVNERTLVVLNAADGRTRHRLLSCESFVAGTHGNALALRYKRGVWLADAMTFSPIRRVLPENAYRAYASPAGFLVTWYGGYAGIDHTGTVTWRNEARDHTPNPAVWHPSGCWLLVTSNRIVSVQPDGRADALCEIPFAFNRTFLADGEHLVDTNGRMLNTRNGTLEWTFDEVALEAFKSLYQTKATINPPP
jgi:hypothetical protein